MNETVKKEQLRSYAEGILKPETVESIMYVESFADEAGDSEVWLLESDTGNEYWLIEGAYPANIIRKSGIYQSAERTLRHMWKCCRKHMRQKSCRIGFIRI